MHSFLEVQVFHDFEQVVDNQDGDQLIVLVLLN